MNNNLVSKVLALSIGAASLSGCVSSRVQKGEQTVPQNSQIRGQNLNETNHGRAYLEFVEENPKKVQRLYQKFQSDRQNIELCIASDDHINLANCVQSYIKNLKHERINDTVINEIDYWRDFNVLLYEPIYTIEELNKRTMDMSAKGIAKAGIQGPAMVVVGYPLLTVGKLLGNDKTYSELNQDIADILAPEKFDKSHMKLTHFNVYQFNPYTGNKTQIQERVSKKEVD